MLNIYTPHDRVRGTVSNSKLMSDFRSNARVHSKKKAKNRSNKTSFAYPDGKHNTKITFDQRIKERDPFYIPDSIQSPHELKWLLKFKMNSQSSGRFYYPVRVLSSKSGAEDSENSSSDEDDDLEATVEFLSLECNDENRKVRQISTKRLIPYHNNCVGSDLDWAETCRSTWSEELLVKYIAQENLMIKNDRVRDYLNSILTVAKERAGYVNDECGDHDALDEPYTQAINMSENESYDSDEDVTKIMNHGRNFIAKEPISPGDVIEYYCPMFVYGSKQGLRTATVISVDPERDFILELSTGDFLQKDSKIKRIKTLSTFQGEQVLVDHPGVVRTIHRFKLRKMSRPKHLKVQTETTRIKKAIKGVIQKFNDDVKDCEVAPMDILVRFKGLEGMEDDDHFENTPKKDRNANTKTGSRLANVLQDSDSDDSIKKLMEAQQPSASARNSNCSQQDNPADYASDDSDEDIITTFLRNQKRKNNFLNTSRCPKSHENFQMNASNHVQSKRDVSTILSHIDSLVDNKSESNMVKSNEIAPDADSIDSSSDDSNNEIFPFRNTKKENKKEWYLSNEENSSNDNYEPTCATSKINSDEPKKKQDPKKIKVSHERIQNCNSKPELTFFVKKFNNH